MALDLTETPDEAYAELRNTIRRIRSIALDRKQKSLDGTLRRGETAQLSIELLAATTVITAKLLVPNLDTFVRSLPGKSAYDVVSEGNQSITAINNLKSWIVTNYPLSQDGFLKREKFDANGNVTVELFTSAQTAGFRTQVDNFVAGLL